MFRTKSKENGNQVLRRIKDFKKEGHHCKLLTNWVGKNSSFICIKELDLLTLFVHMLYQKCENYQPLLMKKVC